jgi:hypothetical protein
MPDCEIRESATCIPSDKDQKQMLPEALCVANRSEEEQATYKIGAIKSYDFEALRLILGLRR